MRRKKDSRFRGQTSTQPFIYKGRKQKLFKKVHTFNWGEKKQRSWHDFVSSSPRNDPAGSRTRAAFHSAIPAVTRGRKGQRKKKSESHLILSLYKTSPRFLHHTCVDGGFENRVNRMIRDQGGLTPWERLTKHQSKGATRSRILTSTLIPHYFLGPMETEPWRVGTWEESKSIEWQDKKKRKKEEKSGQWPVSTRASGFFPSGCCHSQIKLLHQGLCRLAP